MTNSVEIKRSKRIRNKLKKVNTDRFRISIFRSSKNISAQIIDDKNNKTLVSASSIEKGMDKKSKKGDLSNTIAELLAKRATEKKITKVYFDRGQYKYHGRIKAFAEALRKNGVTF
jgi:large subunit ribosomal protein L18|tara:strand:+ start:389 stop:736 length:348 start_codon:yes stop_codon:yes gene_type:complete